MNNQTPSGQLHGPRFFSQKNATGRRVSARSRPCDSHDLLERLGNIEKPHPLPQLEPQPNANRDYENNNQQGIANKQAEASFGGQAELVLW